MATAGHGNFIPSTVSQQFSICHCKTGRESLQATATSGGMWHLRFVGDRPKVCASWGIDRRFSGGGLDSCNPGFRLAKAFGLEEMIAENRTHAYRLFVVRGSMVCWSKDYSVSAG